MTTSFIELNYVRKRELSGEEIAMLIQKKKTITKRSIKEKLLSPPSKTDPTIGLRTITAIIQITNGADYRVSRDFST
jgi:hypothetical protein